MDTFKVALMIITIIAALTTLTTLTTLTKLTRVMEDEASSDLTICCKDKEIRWVDESGRRMGVLLCCVHSWYDIYDTNKKVKVFFHVQIAQVDPDSAFLKRRPLK